MAWLPRGRADGPGLRCARFPEACHAAIRRRRGLPRLNVARRLPGRGSRSVLSHRGDRPSTAADQRSEGGLRALHGTRDVPVLRPGDHAGRGIWGGTTREERHGTGESSGRRARAPRLFCSKIRSRLVTCRSVRQAGAVLDEHQDIQSFQQHGVHMQEVDRDDPGGLGVQELPPGRARAAWRWIDARSSQDFIDMEGATLTPSLVSSPWIRR